MKKAPPTADAAFIPLLRATDRTPLLSSPSVSAIAFTTALPTPEKNDVAAIIRSSELKIAPPATTPP